MKRITAIIVTAAAILGCSYVGTASAATPKVNPDLAYGACVKEATKEAPESMSDRYALGMSCMHGYSEFLYGVTSDDLLDEVKRRIEGAEPANKKTFYALGDFEIRGYLLARDGKIED